MKHNLCLLLILLLQGCDFNREPEITQEEILESRSFFEMPSYYWHKGEKISITPSRNIFYISSSNLESISKSRLLEIGLTEKEQSNRLQFSNGNCDGTHWKIVEISNDGKASAVNPNVSSILTSNDVCVAPVIVRSNGEIVPTSEYFYIKVINKNVQKIIELANSENVTIVSKNLDPWWLMKTPNSSNGLTMANKFYESGLVASSEPAFMVRPETCASTTYTPVDPLYSKQWNLTQIKVQNAWSLTLGDPSIVVAVIDTGVDYQHHELSDNFSNKSIDLMNGQNRPVVYEDHGTHVAGILRASHNNEMIAGVAPNVQLMSVGVPMSYNLNYLNYSLAYGIKHAVDNGADILNNSWGYIGRDGVSEPSLDECEALEDALEYALTKGRNGLGCIVVFASGNESLPAVRYPAYAFDNIIVVGGSKESGLHYEYGNYGSKIDVIAPANQILSTLPSNRTGYMSGTSMAAPHVSGVAALMLSINPELTAKQVEYGICATATKISGYIYTNTKDHNMGPWNEQIGYGLLNADLAVSVSYDLPERMKRIN